MEYLICLDGPEVGAAHKSKERKPPKRFHLLMLPYPPSRECRNQRQVYEDVGCRGGFEPTDIWVMSELSCLKSTSYCGTDGRLSC